jgi:hypothetical protein
VTHDFARVQLQAAPLPTFEVVRDLAPSGSITEADWSAPGHTNVERFADIAKLAGADAFLGGAAPINAAGKVPGGALKPGLNYASELRSKFPDAPAGETGYLDASDVYHNPDLPAERDGALPRIVIVLGPNAFDRGKAHALATLRHEMAHAQHEQLALRWLARWRTEPTSASFKDWLSTQVRAKRLSAVEAAVLASGTGGGTVATEMLAWAEGLVTSLPFTPTVDPALLESDMRYPSTVTSLRGAGKQFNLLGARNDVARSGLDRVRSVCCNVLTTVQRERLIAWIDVLLDPSTLHLTDPARKLLSANFGEMRSFLTEVRDIARKPCAARRA